MERIYYNEETRSFGIGDSIGSAVKSIGSGAKSMGSSLKTSWDKGSFNRSNALFKAGDALSALNANKDLKAQIFGGRGRRIWYKPKTWLKGQKVTGMVNQAGQTATAVTGNEKYEKGAQAASNLGKTATQVGATVHTHRTGMTHAKDGTRIIANAEKANEFGQKMDNKYRDHLATGGKDKFQGTSWTGNIVKQDQRRAMENRGVKSTGAHRAMIDEQFAKAHGVNSTMDFEQAKRNNWFKRLIGRGKFDDNQSIGNQYAAEFERKHGVQDMKVLTPDNMGKGALQIRAEQKANNQRRKDLYEATSKAAQQYNKEHYLDPTTGKYVKRSTNPVANNQ